MHLWQVEEMEAQSWEIQHLLALVNEHPRGHSKVVEGKITLAWVPVGNNERWDTRWGIALVLDPPSIIPAMNCGSFKDILDDADFYITSPALHYEICTHGPGGSNSNAM